MRLAKEMINGSADDSQKILCHKGCSTHYILPLKAKKGHLPIALLMRFLSAGIIGSVSFGEKGSRTIVV